MPLSSEAVNDYADVACLAVLVYELLDSLHDEIKFIWTQKWTTTKFLYLISRYFPFVAFGMFFYYDLDDLETKYTNPSRESTHMIASEFIFNSNLAIVEALFTTRAWALWHRSKPVGRFLVVLYCALCVPILVCLILSARNILSFNRFAQINFGCLTLFYLVTSILMSIRAYQVLSYTNGAQFLWMAHGQGLCYYLFLLFISSFAFICGFILNGKVHILVPRLLQLLFSIMATRMTLNLRKLANRTIRGPGIHSTDILDISTFHFRNTQEDNAEADTPLAVTTETLPTAPTGIRISFV